MKDVILSISVVLMSAGALAAQNTSIYTSTRSSACRTIRSSSEGTGSYVGECRGAAGYKVRLIEGDIRQTLDIITPGKKKFELNFWNIFSSFSSIGDKIEWRMKGKTPVALIARYNVADPEIPEKNTSYPLVSCLGANGACVTDVIAPGPRQIEKARELADKAASKPCKISK